MEWMCLPVFAKGDDLIKDIFITFDDEFVVCTQHP